MGPDKILQHAKAAPDKRGLEAYSDAIWELRTKGSSYRQIAEFLNKRGVPTDHTAVYRLVAAGNPLLGYREGPVFLGDVEYESRKGRPLRPFRAGLLIAIKKKLQIIPLKNAAPSGAIWCEAQFELNETPNHDWLKKLCECLDLDWNPANPQHLQGRWRFELKFETNLMAMVCNTYNLEQAIHDLGTAIQKATKFFQEDKGWLSRLQKMLEQKRVEILEAIIIRPGESEDDAYEECSKWNQENAEKLTKRFNSIPIP
jgi:hypothetical protein